MAPRFRVLSLDLHDTVVWDTAAIVEAQYTVRLSRLADRLRSADDAPVPLEELRRARDSLHSEWVRMGVSAESIPLATQVEILRQRLGARYDGSPEAIVQQYADAGLREFPPRINPEANALVKSLNERGFPVLVVTNTSRSGSAWKAFLEEAGGIWLTEVIASTDVGACKPDPRIFTEMVRRTRVPPPGILHVGDSWAMDVEGARRSGLGAALYRGLAPHYWDPDKVGEDTGDHDRSVPWLDHLSEVNDLLGLE